MTDPSADTASDAAASGTGAPEAGAPEAGAPEAGAPEAGAPEAGGVDRSVPYTEVPPNARLTATPARSTSPQDPPGLRDIAASAAEATMAVGSVAVQGALSVSALVMRRLGASPPARWTKRAATSAFETRHSELDAVGRVAED